MTTLNTTIELPGGEFDFDPAELAAVAFLARYSGRTLDAYRHDLRNLFQWTSDHGLPVLEASRAHLEMYRSSMQERGLAASTIDRRLSTACGFYRFAHIDGRISSNPAQYVRRPTVHPSERRGLDGAELGRFLFSAERFDHAHAALAVLLGLNGLRVSGACDTNIEDMAFERGHRVLRIIGGRSRVGVAGGHLHFSERYTGVEGGHDERCSEHVRMDQSDPGALADRAYPAVSAAAIEALSIVTQQNRAFSAFADGEVDCAGGARDERDEGGFVALAGTTGAAKTSIAKPPTS